MEALIALVCLFVLFRSCVRKQLGGHLVGHICSQRGKIYWRQKFVYVGLLYLLIVAFHFDAVVCAKTDGGGSTRDGIVVLQNMWNEFI